MSASKKDFQEYREQEIAELQLPSPSQSLSRVLPTLKQLDAASIDTLARALVNEVADGTRDGVDLFTLATKLSLFADTLKENVKSYVYGKTLAQKGDKYVLNGVELTPAEIGTKYDYESCKDTMWERLDADLKTAKARKEEREKFLKTIKGKVTVVDDETGEVATIYEPVKSGQSGYRSKVL